MNHDWLRGSQGQKRDFSKKNGEKQPAFTLLLHDRIVGVSKSIEELLKNLMGSTPFGRTGERADLYPAWFDDFYLWIQGTT